MCDLEGLQSRLQGVVKRNEPLARHTSLRIGGPAEYFVIPASLEDIGETLEFAQRGACRGLF
jgi:UDP-N-acetylmuramate dehydrogenase